MDYENLMDYETCISINQYYPGGTVYYSLKVTDIMDQDFYYKGQAKTLDKVMHCIKLHLKNH